MAADDAEADLDPIVKSLRLCIEQGVEIRAEGGGFWLGNALVPKVRLLLLPL